LLIEQIPATKWNLIEINFGHMLLDSIREGAHGLKSERSRDVIIRRKTILFLNGGKLHCTEYIKDDLILFYYYDLLDSRQTPIIKFHSESHSDKKDQTDTEPFHMHVRKDISDLKAGRRIPNYHYRTIHQILSFIETSEFLVPLFGEH
jgi:hypothetical protein